MICKICNEDYTGQGLIKDFVDGVCLPCRVDKDFEQLNTQWDNEIAQYNKRKGTNYVLEGFIYACFAGEVNEADLNGLDELYKFYEMERDRADTTGKCKVCGCTDNDCRQCIEKTGSPCHWVDNDLCSACFTDNGDENELPF